MGKLLCTKCNEIKSEEYFYRCSSFSRGYQYQCKECCNKNSIERKKSPNYREMVRKYSLKSLYKIDAAKYDELYETQQGKCVICGAEKEKWSVGGGKGNNKFLVVDHDHRTGKIRGLICQHCNHGLGHFRDNVKSLKSAIKYLEETKSWN